MMTTARGLRDLQDRLTEVFDSIADGVTVIDRSGVVRFANATAAALMGRNRPEDVIGLSAAQAAWPFDLLDEDGGPMDVGQLPTGRVLAGEEAAEAVVRFRPRGTLLDSWSMVRARLLRGAHPSQDLVVTAFQDVTALKLTEIRSRFLSGVSAVLGRSTDYEETLLLVARLAVPQVADWCAIDVVESDQAMRRIALAHADPEKVRLAAEIQRRWPADLDQGGAVARVIASGQLLHAPTVTAGQLRQAIPDDEQLARVSELGIRSALIVPLLARGQVLGALTLADAESQRELTAEDVAMADVLGRRVGWAVDTARLLAESREALRLRDEFIAAASHDMRTPLAAVRGYAQLARRHIAAHPDPDPVALDRWLADIDLGASRLTGLVSELTDASLIRGGQDVPLQPQPIDLTLLVAERVEEHRGASGMREIGFEVADEPVVGEWDPARLGRVIDNLIGNAVKFSDEGSRVLVRVGRREDGGYVTVRDEGIGIPATDLKLIFVPTYRARNAGRVSGTGLGLAGSKRLVEQMGGRIEVESRLGEGSTFTVWLPLEEPAAPTRAGA